MAKDCCVCGDSTIFYVWSTSRKFPREKLIACNKYETKYDKMRVAVEGLPVCFKCLNKMREDDV